MGFQVVVQGHRVIGPPFTVVTVCIRVGAQNVVRGLAIMFLVGDVVETNQALCDRGVILQRLLSCAQIAQQARSILHVEKTHPWPHR